MATKTKLTVVKKQTAEQKADEERQHRQQLREAQEKRWMLDKDQIEGRVREVRRTLETFSLRLAGVQFDIIGYSMPRSLDYGPDVDPSVLAERLCPSIKGYHDRLDDVLSAAVDQHVADLGIRDDLGAMYWLVADLSFAIGVMAGAIFQGATEHEIDRLERGLLHATLSRVPVKSRTAMDDRT